MLTEPSRDQLEAAHCWEADDRVPGRPEMTAFRRRARLAQAQWREAHGVPIGTQPIAPGRGASVRLVGSRIAHDHAAASGANLLSDASRRAARDRFARSEPHQSIDRQRTWCDLLWSTAFAFNLFGDVAADLRRAERVVRSWFPDAPGPVREVRFLHSPGWLDPSFTGSLVAFDVAFVLEAGDGSLGIVGVHTRYHDRSARNDAKPQRLARYVDIARRSHAFRRGAEAAADGTDLVVTWLGHLLVHSMLQHPDGRWRWGRFVVVHPGANPDQADVAARYRELLRDDDPTFHATTLEALLASGALPRPASAAVHDRYLAPLA